MVFRRGVLGHISDAANMSQQPSGSKVGSRLADLVVNCTGLSSGTLGGVEDKGMMPVRGQTLLVRNEADVMCYSSGTEEGDEEVCYVMQRAAGQSETPAIDPIDAFAQQAKDLCSRRKHWVRMAQ